MWFRASLISISLSVAACNTGGGKPDAHAGADPTLPTPAPSECPTGQLREDKAPNVAPELERAEYWLAKLPAATVDAELLDPAEREYLAARVAELPGGWRDPLGRAGADPQLVERELSERLEWLRGRVSAGAYVETSAGALEQAAAQIQAAELIEGPQLRFVVEETQLWCVPSTEGLYTDPIDLDFDRNRCASLHPGELVRGLRATPDQAWIYVDAGHSVGWVEHPAAALGPAIDPATARAQLGVEPAAPRAWVTNDFEHLRAGSSFVLLSQDEARSTLLVPGPTGPIERELPIDAPLSTTALRFSQRAVFEQAFALLDQPYGWGGREGQRDCSRYLFDLFAQFDLRLARNSGVQAQLGTRSVDLSQLDEASKRAQVRAAAREGVVLLYMPGHIMLYLGEDGGLDYGISALSEYLVPCPGGPDTVHRLDRVAVTTLELGRGTERTAFIERISRMAVFGPAPELPSIESSP
ncbi:NlpC/P60 family protein [Enhygromyxa salina]|uniref:SH3 domain of the SH3b1 type n=1 Tax=Enhygromyxa salina TaxID=215803 RepID=A0A2S9XWT0_9BACT|nr:NlpC/P60 family protein [Enhygromyxa salina]PRP97337.1 SH3 domain of the SH3b1 type [Enhygromyxa salina]